MYEHEVAGAPDDGGPERNSRRLELCERSLQIGRMCLQCIDQCHRIGRGPRPLSFAQALPLSSRAHADFDHMEVDFAAVTSDQDTNREIARTQPLVQRRKFGLGLDDDAPASRAHN
jgi:hypothetical protein